MNLAELIDRQRRAALDDLGHLAHDWDPMRSSLSHGAAVEDKLLELDRYARLAREVEAEARRSEAEGPYAPGSGNSFFQDMVSWRERPDAARRMQEHRERSRVATEVERRDIGTSGLGALVPPSYLVSPATMVARSDLRPFLTALVGSEPGRLPATGDTLTVPVSTTASTAAYPMATQNTAVTEQDPIITGRSVPVVTVAGQVDVSRQLIERGGEAVDRVIGNDLLASLAAEQERQVILGTGTNGQLHGLLSATGVTFVTASTATGPSVANRVLEAARQGAEARKGPTRVIGMTSTRRYWLNATSTATYENTLERMDPDVFTIAESYGLDTATGVSSNQDTIITASPGDLLYLESPVYRVTTRGTLANQGTVKLVVFAYAALVPLRPSAIVCVSGLGLVPPAALS